MKLFGKMNAVPFELEGRTHYRPVLENGTPWKDAAKESPGTLFIAVVESGRICCAESDPTMLMISGVDILQINTDLPRESVIGKKWDGTQVLDEEVLD